MFSHDLQVCCHKSFFDTTRQKHISCLSVFHLLWPIIDILRKWVFLSSIQIPPGGGGGDENGNRNFCVSKLLFFNLHNILSSYHPVIQSLYRKVPITRFPWTWATFWEEKRRGGFPIHIKNSFYSKLILFIFFWFKTFGFLISIIQASILEYDEIKKVEWNTTIICVYILYILLELSFYTTVPLLLQKSDACFLNLSLFNDWYLRNAYIYFYSCVFKTIFFVLSPLIQKWEWEGKKSAG